MTQLYINGQTAILPEGFTISFTAENPYFTRSSNYSLDVELPMSANHAIFGHIHRLDVTKQKTILPATLIVDNRTLIRGSAVLLSVEDTLVKVQLVSGNAEFNLLTNDDVYIDELDLGEVPWPEDNAGMNWWEHSKMDLYYASVDKLDAVYLPVCYQEMRNYPMNFPFYHVSSDKFALNTKRTDHAAQPYLLAVIRRLMQHFGYTLDDTFFNGNFLRNLYICSAVNSNRISDALPHWTVSEFLDELEKLFCVIIVIDEGNKTVRFVPLNDYFDNTTKTGIESSSILRSFSVNMEEQKEEKDISNSNVSYDLSMNTSFNKYWKIDSIILDKAHKEEYATYQAALQAYTGMSKDDKKSTLFKVGDRYYMNFNNGAADSLMEVNRHADLIRDSKSSDEVRFKIVPADMYPVTFGLVSSVSQGMMNVREKPLVLNCPFVSFTRDTEDIERFNIQEAIDGDNETSIREQPKNDRMEVAFNTGDYNIQTPQSSNAPTEFAYSFVDYTQKPSAQTSDFKPYSLNLHDVCPDSIGHLISTARLYHSNIPYTIQFLADKMPDVNKVFLIGNKQYLCEKIEAEIDIHGLNKVLKGTFYRIE